MTKRLTAARLRELLHYDPETGVFRHIAPRQGIIAGSVAGSLGTNGYRKHRMDGETHSGHRLAWLYMTGEWPKFEIDHINGDRADNRFANLRDVPGRVNRQNMRRALGKVGLLGVCRHRDVFRAEIGIDNKAIRLGTFKTPEEAHEAYLKAKRQLHEGCTI